MELCEPETCPQCGKTVKKLRLHMMAMHTNEEDKQYRCQDCGKGFALKSKLNQHAYTHLEVKPFKCRYDCGQTFADHGNRTKHEKIHVVPNPDKAVKEDIAVNQVKVTSEGVDKEM